MRVSARGGLEAGQWAFPRNDNSLLSQFPSRAFACRSCGSMLARALLVPALLLARGCHAAFPVTSDQSGAAAGDDAAPPAPPAAAQLPPLILGTSNGATPAGTGHVAYGAGGAAYGKAGSALYGSGYSFGSAGGADGTSGGVGNSGAVAYGGTAYGASGGGAAFGASGGGAAYGAGTMQFSVPLGAPLPGSGSPLQSSAGRTVVVVQPPREAAHDAPLAALNALAGTLGPSYVAAHDAVFQAGAATTAAAVLAARNRAVATADAFAAGSAAVLQSSVALHHDLAQATVDGVKGASALWKAHADVHRALIFGGQQAG